MSSPVTEDFAALTLRLAAEAGVAEAEGWGNGVVGTLAEVTRRLKPRANAWLRMADAGDAPGELIAPPVRARLAPAQHRAGLPPSFAAEDGIAACPEWRLHRVPDGIVLRLRHEPVVIGGDGRTLRRDLSNRYGPLAQFLPVDLRKPLKAATRIDAPLFVLGDDIWPANYCHWLLDWLPRLAALRRVADAASVRIAVGTLEQPYQRETLRLCGIDDARVVELAPWQAVRARAVLATSDIPAPPHPAFKGAAWALRFLRTHLGADAVRAQPYAAGEGARLFVSRGDAQGRRILNEPDLLALLAARGYRAVTLAKMTVREQAKLFASASHIVAAHGAGLANLAFATRGATVLELFPSTYGTPAYRLLAARAGLTYASYVTDRIASGSRTQLDDMEIDVADFAARCGDVL
jgi:capsular polysaccharide biosynthesis protein